MSASKHRPRWTDLPAGVRTGIEALLGAEVVGARSCPGGFSPGFASRLALAGHGRAFVKAMDAVRWPWEATLYRDEARVSAALPNTVPAPRLLGTGEVGGWVVLAFEDVDGVEPRQPWRAPELARVVAATRRLAEVLTPAPVAVPDGQPRLGGWAGIDIDSLATHSPWAARNLDRLVALERQGLRDACGDTLVHFDVYPHNILLSGDGVRFVDWPHARRGSPLVDLVMLLSTAAADGIDPRPYLLPGEEPAVTAILAALAGFLFAGALSPMPAGLEPIAAAKLRLARGAELWLRRSVG